MQNKNLWMGIGLFIAVVAVSAYLIFGKGSAYTPSPLAQPTMSETTATPSGPVKAITIEAKEFGFTPSKISVNKGDNVSITFKNSGAFPHNLTISDLGLATNIVSPGGEDTLNFTADKVGTFGFICSVDSHKDKGMTGTLEVK